MSAKPTTKKHRWVHRDATSSSSAVVMRPWLDDVWCRSRCEQGDALCDFLRGEACHIRNFFKDGMYDSLRAEATDVVPWSTHQKTEAWGPLTDAIFSRLEKACGMRNVAGRRFNLYASGEGKPLHQDRNAHSELAGNLTVTASIGAPRRLRLVPLYFETDTDRGGLQALQKDGDVFCFTSKANSNCLHGIDTGSGERISLVVWGDADPLSQIALRLQSEKK